MFRWGRGLPFDDSRPRFLTYCGFDFCVSDLCSAFWKIRTVVYLGACSALIELPFGRIEKAAGMRRPLLLVPLLAQAALLSVSATLPILCCVLPSICRISCSGVIQNFSTVSVIASLVRSRSSLSIWSLEREILGAPARFATACRRDVLDVGRFFRDIALTRLVVLLRRVVAMFTPNLLQARVRGRTFQKPA